MSQDRPRGLFPAHVKGEDRRKAIEAPGPTWKEWALETGLKPWVGLLLLILDSFVLASFLEVPSVAWKWGALAAILPLGYADYLAWAFLWARLPEDPKARRSFRPSWHHPFAVGLLMPDHRPWKSGELRKTDEGSVPPEEFL